MAINKPAESWFRKNPFLAGLSTTAIPLTALVFAFYSGVLPHLERHIDDQLKIQVNESLKEPIKDIGRIREDIANIKGKLEPYDQILRDYLRNKIKSSIRLTPESLKASLPELGKTIVAARNAKIPIEPKVVADVGKHVLGLAEKQPEQGDIWQAVKDFVNYRSFLNPSRIPPSGRSVRHDPTLYAFLETKGKNIKTYHVGDVPRQEAAVLEPIGAGLNKNNPRGDAFIILTDGELTLDGTDMKNVILENIRITYHGGPLRMNNVVFVNCTFEMQENQNGRQFALAVLVHESAVFYAS